LRHAFITAALDAGVPLRDVQEGGHYALVSPPQMGWQPRITRLSAGVFAVWSLLVGGALFATLHSLRAEPFDGLNNLFQIPFALPWFLIPIGGIWSHETDAWIAAGMGWFNGLLILMFLPAWLSRRRERPGAA
jgi:hypothetical protein